MTLEAASYKAIELINKYGGRNDIEKISLVFLSENYFELDLKNPKMFKVTKKIIDLNAEPYYDIRSIF